MDAAAGGHDQPAKANEENKRGVSHIVPIIGQTLQGRKQWWAAEHDLEGCCTSTPLPAQPAASIGTRRRTWNRPPQQQQPQQKPSTQALPSLQKALQTWCSRLLQALYMMTLRPFADPTYCGPQLVLAVLAVLLSVALVPLGVALQLHSSPGFKVDQASTPWSGVLYIAAAVPLLRVLAVPVRHALFWLGELVIVGWPVFSKVPCFADVAQPRRFAWLLVSLALLVWHAAVFRFLLEQPLKLWMNKTSVAICYAQAQPQNRYACVFDLVSNYSLKALCFITLVCVASCISAGLGMWLFYRMLAAHGFTDQEGVSPLLLQEVYLAVCRPKSSADKRTREVLLEPFKQQSQPGSTSPPAAAAIKASLNQQQQQQRAFLAPSQLNHQHTPLQPTAGAKDATGTAVAAAAAACTLLAAVASLSAMVLAVAVVAESAPTAGRVAVAAAVAVPASAAAAVGSLAALAAMLYPAHTEFTAFGAAASACSAAAIACAAAIAAAAMDSTAVVTRLVSVGLEAAAIVGFLAAAAATVLELVAVEGGEQWSRQRHSRAKQAAACSLLSSMMHNLQHMAEQTSGGTEGLTDGSSWGSRFRPAWDAEGSGLWLQLVGRALPRRDTSNVTSLTKDDVRPLFQELANASAAAEEAFALFDSDRDGKITEADMQAFTAYRTKRQLGVALTIDNKREAIMSIERGMHVLVQVVFVVLYMGVFGVGTLFWSGTIGALAFLLLGIIWVFGYIDRQVFGSAAWLVTARPFDVGDIISLNGSDWRVLRIRLLTTTLQCLTSGVPHTIPNAQLTGSSSSGISGSSMLANKSRCSVLTGSVEVSIVGMSASRLEAFIGHLRAAAEGLAAAQPGLYLTGSCGVRLLGDKMVCNGTVDFVEAELVIEWKYSNTACGQGRVADAKAGMLRAVREQYNLFMIDNTRPIPDVDMFSNPVYN